MTGGIVQDSGRGVTLLPFKRVVGLNRVVVPLVVGNMASSAVLYAGFVAAFGRAAG